MEQMNSGKVCGCPHHKIIPVTVVVFGLLFLLGALGVFSSDFVGVVWPILVIFAGLNKLFGGSCKCCQQNH